MSQLVYEERLGTKRMLPLIFQMALPAINWQFLLQARDRRDLPFEWIGGIFQLLIRANNVAVCQKSGNG